MTTPDPDALARAYAGARYGVLVDGDAVALRVGERAVDLEAYVPAASYALITAWNPQSRAQPDMANRAADAALLARLDALGVARLRAWADAEDGSWREDGWLLLDPAPSLADALGREFGQAGVLAWASAQPVALRMLPPPAADLDVDGDAGAHADAETDRRSSAARWLE